MGHFDGMTDCYEYSNTNDDLKAQVKYIFVENIPSDKMVENILQFVDKKDTAKQFDTDKKIQEFFNDYSMNRHNLALRLFRGHYNNFSPLAYWEEQAA